VFFRGLPEIAGAQLRPWVSALDIGAPQVGGAAGGSGRSVVFFVRVKWKEKANVVLVRYLLHELMAITIRFFSTVGVRTTRRMWGSLRAGLLKL